MSASVLCDRHLETITMSSAVEFPLDRGERQLWSGCPRQGIAFRPTDLLIVPFSLLWGGFVVFWELSVWRTPAPRAFALFGVPFVGMAVYITVGRFFVDALRRSRTAYVVTSERIIITSGLWSSEIKSLALSSLSEVTLSERRDGSGTISFGPTAPIARMYVGTPWPGIPRAVGFEMIPSARGVYDLIRQAQQASRAKAG